ncbi:flavin-containing monooxygenase [Arthrobacter sp. NPDC055138]
MTQTTDFDVLIVGAGWSGMLALHRLRSRGFSARVLEAAPEVGGTWYWNRYPGARCDVESIHYSYSFDDALQQEWNWTERYASQSELLSYARHVADRFDLRRDIQFNTKISSAVFNEDLNQWTLHTDNGERYTSKFCILATGVLSTPKVLDLPGLENFGGTVLNTFDWPEEPVDFTGKSVAVLGTGSSGIQAIPEIAKTAEQLYVLQRTPSFSLPAHNRPLTPEELDAVKAGYSQLREASRNAIGGIALEETGKSAFEVSEAERTEIFEQVYAEGQPFKFQGLFTDQMTDRKANATAADFVARKIAERVEDPETAAALTPSGYPIATRRLCIDTGYYETFNRENVTLVNLLKEPVTGVTGKGIATAERTYEVDYLVLATGFDAVTGSFTRIDVRGRGGQSLKEKWGQAVSSYLGLAVHGFPNLFTITGPLSPSVLSNMMVSIEHHVDWISDCLAYLEQNDIDQIEPTEEAEREWGRHTTEVANFTLFPQSGSWYTGANIDGKPSQVLPYVGGVHNYRQITQEIADDGYRGFAVRSREAAQLTG